MNEAIKGQIMAASWQFRKAYPNKKTGKEMSAADFCKLAGVGETNYSLAINGKFVNGTSPIPETFFRKVAAVVGFQLEASYWHHVDTIQYVQAVNTLEEARERSAARMILGETGCGKTYALDRFCAANPVGVYRITVNDCDTLRDIMAELVGLLRIDTKDKNGSLLRCICSRLRDLAMDGQRPILIFDEVENLKRTGIKAIKAVYDVVGKIVPIVLVGTPDFAASLASLKARGVKGMAQFARRFKAGRVDLAPIDRRFSAFMGLIGDESLRRALCDVADNYGELHDYLERAIREADESGEPLTVELFRRLYNLKTA